MYSNRTLTTLITDKRFEIPTEFAAVCYTEFYSEYTVKKFSDIFPQIVGQLKRQMDGKLFQRYSRKYFRHRTGNSSYCLVGEISSLLGNIDIFHNLSRKRSIKSEQIFVFVE